MLNLKEYNKTYQDSLIGFLHKCLPESGRTLDIDGRHKMYKDINRYFDCFLCMFDNEMIIGTVGIKKLNNKKCELKSLYIFKDYYGKSIGFELLSKVIKIAIDLGYDEMYLDTLSNSKRAISLYEKIGFKVTKKYNDNEFADIFMVLDLKNPRFIFEK